jgi:hypothetical protein
MKSTSRSRTHRLFPILVVAIGALAMLALPALASAKHHHHPWATKAHRGGHFRHHLSGTGPGSTGSSGSGASSGQENAGTIASFDGTTLTINLNDGHTLSGQVTSSTEIECSQGESQEDSEEGEQGDSEDQSDDQSQPGGQVQPQDQGGQSGDQGQSGDSQDQSDDEQGEGSDDGTCTTAALVPGAIVHEADLEAGPGGEVFRSVHLAG